MKIFFIIILFVLIIWLLTKKLKNENEERISQISGELRVKYPNFVRAIRVINGDSATIHADNNKALSYKVAITTFQRHMGDLYFSLIDMSQIGNKTYVILVYKGLDATEIATEKHYLQSDRDLNINDYEDIFSAQAREIMGDLRYLNSVSILNK